MASVTIVPSSYTGASNCTAGSSYPFSNGYTNTSSTTYARLQTSTSGSYTGIVYYVFDTSSIPSNATINSVTMKAKFSVNSTTNITEVSVQPSSGTTLKGSANTTRSTTATVYTLTAGTWTRSELDDARLSISFTRKSGGGSRYFYFYGAELIVEYTEAGSSDTMYFKSNGTWVQVTKAYKKVSGSWVEQSDLTSVFQSGVNYRKG